MSAFSTALNRLLSADARPDKELLNFIAGLSKGGLSLEFREFVADVHRCAHQLKDGPLHLRDIVFRHAPASRGDRDLFIKPREGAAFQHRLHFVRRSGEHSPFLCCLANVLVGALPSEGAAP